MGAKLSKKSDGSKYQRIYLRFPTKILSLLEIKPFNPIEKAVLSMRKSSSFSWFERLKVSEGLFMSGSF